MYFDGRDI